MTTTDRFWDRIADRYSRKPVPDEAIYQEKLRITREHLGPESSVLEIGCGTGSTAIAHAPRVKSIRAVDISARMIEIAKEKAQAAGVTNILFEQASVDEIDVAYQSQDVVLALSILHLVEDRDDALKLAFEALKPGGVLVSSTACLGDNLKIFKYIGPIGRFLGLIPTVRVFTVQELKDSLTGAGFEIEHDWQPGRNTGVFIVARKPL
ncbi:MAG: class I SAM-dependent methyltransferase [Woeseiaceae bacterium]